MTERRREPDSVDFATHAVGGLAIVVSVVLAYAATDSSSPLIFTAGFVALVALRPSIRFVRRARFRWHQSARDTLAAEIAASTDVGFFLYLRPFNSTGKLPILLSYVERWYKSPASSRPQTWTEEDEIDLETELARALEPFGNLVGLGQPGEHAGAGRTAVGEADWQTVFLSLAERASAIFIVPATTDGTRWELDQLLARPDWARKSYFVIPPSLGPLVFGYGSAVGGYGQDALKALRQRGFELEPTNEGRLLKLDEDGRLVGPKLLQYFEPTSGSSYRNKLVAKHGLREAILKSAPHLAERTNERSADPQNPGPRDDCAASR